MFNNNKIKVLRKASFQFLIAALIKQMKILNFTWSCVDWVSGESSSGDWRGNFWRRSLFSSILIFLGLAIIRLWWMKRHVFKELKTDIWCLRLIHSSLLIDFVWRFYLRIYIVTPLSPPLSADDVSRAHFIIWNFHRKILKPNWKPRSNFS